ncbi:hypothetical protein [Streptomyces sp. NPDC056987]|uniref:hypothetical protein n=1 Tax=Streptomyces sp. NPDC056987 TaxID=3345988 RepID=UPI00363E1FF5
MTTLQPSTQVDPLQQTVYRTGDYVLYRDGDKFWAGKPQHTFVCRVLRVFEIDAVTWRYQLLCLTTRGTVASASPAYMRLLPPLDAMRDIDTASLDDEDTVLTAAAIAWLRQQYGKSTV